jgi:hypothetical protein
VRKKFLNLNVADIGAKKAFYSSFKKIFSGKMCFKLMSVWKKFFDHFFFFVLKKLFSPEIYKPVCKQNL